jgi:hypothetical protein
MQFLVLGSEKITQANYFQFQKPTDTISILGY